MKKSVLIISFFIVAISFYGCSSDESSPNNYGEIEGQGVTRIVDLIPVDESICSFFQKEIQKTYYGYTDGFSIEENTCYRIDSQTDFAKLYNGNDILPEIDFSKYTLILGSKVYSAADTDIENVKQSLVESEDGYELNLYSHHMEGDWTSICMILELYYYGIYPKLKDKEILVNLIYE